MSATLAEATRGLRERGENALVAFLTAGYPDERTFVELAVGSSRAGADVIEIGIPFSDPIADGPAIQAASEAALAGGMTLPRALALAGEVAGRTDTPLVAMSYLNPLLNMGLEQFAEIAVRSGVGGVILPDVPVEESAPIRRVLQGAGVAPVHLVAPTSGPERVSRIAQAADGGAFLYLVSVTGVTGGVGDLPAELEGFVARVRRESHLPLYVGFGVSTASQAQRVTRFADGVIIGSQLVRLASEGSAREVPGRAGAFLSGAREAISAA